MSNSYTKKFLNPKWQKKRLEILERDGFICQRCYDDKSTLHVHHMYYVSGRDPWDYPAGSLVTLCDSCHSEEHSGNRSEIDNISRAFENIRFFECFSEAIDVTAIFRICSNPIEITNLSMRLFDYGATDCDLNKLMDFLGKEITGEKQ